MPLATLKNRWPGATRIATLCLGAISFFVLGARAQTVYDAVTQFNNTGVQNAGGAWTYGTETSLNGPFSLMPNLAKNQPCTGTCSPGGQTYSDYYYSSPTGGAGVTANTSASPRTITFAGPIPIVWPNDVLLVGPAGLNHGGPILTVIRWTAPQSGTYNISGFFLNLEQSNTYEYVSINGTTVFSNTSTFNGREETGGGIQVSGSGLTNVSIGLGGTVDFIVATASGTNDYNDALGLSATIAAVSPALTFDAVQGFNMSGVQPQSGNAWTYGTETTLNGTLSLYPPGDFAHETCNGVSCTPNGATSQLYYYQSANVGPAVNLNTSGGTITYPASPPLVWPDNVLLTGPGAGSNPQYAVVRWTAPVAGVYYINGYWQDQQQAKGGLHVSVNNGSQETDGFFNGSSALQGQVPFSLSAVTMSAGETVDFICDNGNTGTNGNDAVGLSATILQYPNSLTASGTPQTAVVGSAFPAPLTVLVTGPAGAPLSGALVKFTAPSSGATASLSETSVVTGPDGTATVTATANGRGGAYNVTATQGTVSVDFALVNVALQALTLSPTLVTGGNSTRANTVTLTAAAPANGALITLTSGNPGIAIVPGSVTVAAGATVSTPFSIATTGVSVNSRVTIKASDGINTQSATLTVRPAAIASVKLSHVSVVGGNPVQDNQVTLTGAAPQGGSVVTLTSSNPVVAAVPASVEVPAGGTSSPAFTITTTPVAADTQVTISATYLGVTKTATLTVTAAQLSAVSLNPASVTGGKPTTNNTVRLSGAAPAGGTVVTLTSANPAVATVPPTVTVQAGARSAAFTVTTTAVSTDTVVAITGTLAGVSKSANLTVVP